MNRIVEAPAGRQELPALPSTWALKSLPFLPAALAARQSRHRTHSSLCQRSRTSAADRSAGLWKPSWPAWKRLCAKAAGICSRRRCLHRRRWLGRRLRPPRLQRQASRRSLLFTATNAPSPPKETADKIATPRMLFRRAGAQPLRINTLYQLLADAASGIDPHAPWLLPAGVRSLLAGRPPRR